MVVLAPLALWGIALAAHLLPFDDVLDQRDVTLRRGRGVADADVLLWPDCAVPFVVAETATCADFFSSKICKHAASPEIAAVVRRSISVGSAELRRLTGCYFYEDTTAERPLAVTAESGKYYVNHVGRLSQRTNLMNLGVSALGAREGSVKHELLHVLGIEHEHQGPKSETMLERCESGDCGEAGNRNCRIDLTVESWVSTAYDFLSIMHYPLGDVTPCKLEVSAAGADLLQALNINSDSVGRVYNISSLDAAAVRTLYNMPLVVAEPTKSSGTANPSGSTKTSELSGAEIAAIVVGGVFLVVAIIAVATQRPQARGRYTLVDSKS